MRDADQGYPLRALLRVIAEQVNLVEAGYRQALRQLVHRDLRGLGRPLYRRADRLSSRCTPAAGRAAADAQARNRIMVPRREVANTIRYRRRKGTLSIVEDLASAVSGWPAHAQEFYRLLAVNQNINHLRLTAAAPPSFATATRWTISAERSTRWREASTCGAPSPAMSAAAPISRPRRLRLAPALLHRHPHAGLLLRGGIAELLPVQPARQRYRAVREAQPRPHRACRPTFACPRRSAAAISRRAKRRGGSCRASRSTTATRRA